MKTIKFMRCLPFLVCLTLLIMLSPSYAVMNDYCINPPFIVGGVTPNLLMMFDNSSSMYDLNYAWVRPRAGVGIAGPEGCRAAACHVRPDRSVSRSVPFHRRDLGLSREPVSARLSVEVACFLQL